MPRPVSRDSLLASFHAWIPLFSVLTIVSAVTGFGLAGAQRPHARPTRQALAAPPAAVARPVAAVAPAAPEAPEDVRELVILAQKKRIMGRKASLPAVRQVAMVIGPLVARALDQPAIQEDLRALAQASGMSLSEYKSYWKRKQEADLLLESGGDANARSVADAIGVAQWLASTGRANGLRIDAGASRQLTYKIYRLQARIDALLQRPATWTDAAPSGIPAPRPLLAATPAAPTKVAAQPHAADLHGSPPDPTAGTSPAPAETKAAETPVEAGRPTAETPNTEAKPANVEPKAEGGATAGNPEASRPEPTAPIAEPKTPEHAGAATPATPPSAPNSPTLMPREPGRPTWSRDQFIAYSTQQIRQAESQRRAVDERYDPARAIAVQTRYLVRLARRYGSLDWVYQAYHGGEGGVERTVSTYLGSGYTRFASAGAAIRGTLPQRGMGASRRARRLLSFEDLYFGATPLTHPDAFSYLYGRSDHHRYYWWKILMAERAIDLYRTDPRQFRREWSALRPGQRLEVAWYPNVAELSFHSKDELKAAYAKGKLVRLPANLKPYGLATGNSAALDAANAYAYKGLRPAAMGALLRLAQIYRDNGGAGEPLRIQSLVQTTGYTELLAVKFPPPWVKNPPDDPADVHIDLHATGLCFDLERPRSDWHRKVLEYALGILADRGRIYWVDESIFGPRRYHVCPSPDYSRELARTLQATRPAGAKKRG